MFNVRLMRPSKVFWEQGKMGIYFVVTRGTNAKFWEEQGNKDNIREQGNIGYELLRVLPPPLHRGNFVHYVFHKAHHLMSFLKVTDL